MLNFLAPAALTGLVLLALPIAVHLFKPRKMRQTPFSSLRWLRITQQKFSRRIRWHQVFLFALRAAFILFLVLALARPLLSPNSASRYTDRFIVLDVSRSMAYQPAGRISPFAQAKQVAAEIMTRRRAGDRTALLFTGSTTRVVTPPSVDALAFLPALEAAQPTSSDTNLSSALAVIRPMLVHARPDTDAEIYVLTDNHQQSWNQAAATTFARDLPVSVKVNVVDVGVKGAANGWIAEARLSTLSGSRARRVIRIDLGATGDQPQHRTVRIHGVSGVAEQEISVVLEAGRPTSATFEIPGDVNLRGQVAELRLEPADALPSDDRYFLNFDTAGALRVLLVEADAAEGTPGAAYHLNQALETLAEERGFEFVHRSVSSATPRDFSQADVIFLAAAPELMAPQLDALEARVKAGAGLAVFLGPRLRLDFYNTQLYKPQQPADGLLPAPLKSEERAGSGALTNLRWDHRLLAPFRDPKVGDLEASRFQRYYRFAVNPGDADLVLARIEDDVPAIIEHSLGAGRVLLFNTTANDDWSNLARRASYVPLLDRLVNDLSAHGVRRQFEAGEPITLPLSDWKPGEAISVRGPGDVSLSATIAGSAARPFLRLNPVSEVGVYRVERGSAEKNEAFVVNAGRGDSVLVPIEPEALIGWFAPTPAEVISPDAVSQRLAWSAAEMTMWPWLVGFAAAALIAEMFFVHWLCPRMNPALATVVVHRRGLLKKKDG